MCRNIKINLKKIIYLLLLAVGISNASMSYAMESKHTKENMNAHSMCTKEVKHTTLYDFGKMLATGAMYYKTTTEGKSYTPKTKSSFLLSGLTGYIEKNGIPDSNILYYCYSGYLSTAKNASWSSVHQGFIDYLPNASKAMFLSLPER